MDESGFLTPTQRFVTRWVGRETAVAVEAQSRAWLVRCPHCAFERSIWEIGGIRYKAAGSPRLRIRCPHCGQTGWHEVHKSANFPAGDVPAWPIVRLILSVLLALLILGTLIAGLVLKLTGVI